jgi:hypothetical protein
MPETIPALIDDAVLIRLTGQTAVRDVASAEAQFQNAVDELERARREFARARWRRRYAALRRIPARLGVPPWAAALIAASGASILVAAAMIATPFATLPMLLSEVFATYALLGGAAYLALADRPGEAPEAREAIREQQWRAAVDANVRAVAELHRAAARHEAAVALVAGLRAAQVSPLNHLLLLDVRTMNRLQFEQYLIDLLRVLGHGVRRASGGARGVDLIVELSQDERVAVGVQGDASAEVGANAVVQAHGGMSFHGCRRCAVFTNCGFSAEGRAAAERVECGLIGPDRIPALVRGDLAL